MRRSPANRRDGYVMVLLAMLLFGLFAMAALVIDLGFARLAQRQMQTAADTAALEGLRGEGIPSLTYEDRQLASEMVVAWTFDDDLDASNGDDGIAGDGGAFGAGPLVSFTDGAGDPDLFASQLMTVDPNNTAYKPTMQRRTDPTGDGQFVVAIQRGDAIVGEYDSFAQGPSVPYLFARGSLIERQRIGDGISVGGQAIARARPAVRVGPPVESLPGVVPVAYERNNWGATPADPLTITSDISSGVSIGETITVGGTATPPASGYCVIYDAATSRVIGFGPLGQTVTEEGVVAQRNATAHLIAASDAFDLLTPTELADVLDANRSLEFALMAPVLVRN